MSQFRFLLAVRLAMPNNPDMSDQRRSYHDQRYVHFVTFSVYRRRRLLELNHPNRIVLGVLNHQLEAMSARCLGFVVMRDHVHALLWLPEPRDLQRFLDGWKRMSSFVIRRWYAEFAPHDAEVFGQGEQFWQPKSYAFQIYSEHKLLEKLTYMHENPVRSGLVTRAIDSRWSSARW